MLTLCYIFPLGRPENLNMMQGFLFCPSVIEGRWNSQKPQRWPGPHAIKLWHHIHHLKSKHALSTIYVILTMCHHSFQHGARSLLRLFRISETPVGGLPYWGLAPGSLGWQNKSPVHDHCEFLIVTVNIIRLVKKGSLPVDVASMSGPGVWKWWALPLELASLSALCGAGVSSVVLCPRTVLNYRQEGERICTHAVFIPSLNQMTWRTVSGLKWVRLTGQLHKSWSEHTAHSCSLAELPSGTPVISKRHWPNKNTCQNADPYQNIRHGWCMGTKFMHGYCMGDAWLGTLFFVFAWVLHGLCMGAAWVSCRSNFSFGQMHGDCMGAGMGEAWVQNL